MSATDYGEDAILDHFLGVAATSSPASLWLQLHTSLPGEDAGTGSYLARQQVTFGAAVNGVAANTNSMLFTAVSTVSVSHFSIWDAQSLGNPLFTGSLEVPIALTNGENMTVPVGGVEVTAE